MLYGERTSITDLHKHLLHKDHIDMWIAECKRLGIHITAKKAVEVITAHQGVTPNHQALLRLQFTSEHFIDALAEFIVATDQVLFIFIFIFIFTNHIYLQPISIVDSKEFRSLLLLLKKDLEEKDIPRHTTMTKWILKLHQQQVEHLSNQMLVSIVTLLIILS